jgi:hypothetical protein
VTIGIAAQPDHTYSWSPGGYTVAQPTVSPTATTTYTVTATTACGSKTDSVTITVGDGGSGGYSEDFEGDTSGWSTSGLWHLADSSSCISPGYSSPTHAFYYGQDSTCNYDAGDNSGDLISPTMSGINADSTLSWQYYRNAEYYDQGAFDTATVSVEIAGSNSWTDVWSKDSTDASEDAWTAVNDISLSSFAGNDIRIRFQFDTIDDQYNGYIGWFIDDVVVTGDNPCGNTPPTVTISSPSSGASYPAGTSVSFSGSAEDNEDGDLTADLAWTSSIDGSIGSGGSFSYTLSAGSHTITASVSDYGDPPLSGSAQITVNITSENNPPEVSITAPPDGSVYDLGDTVGFTGTAEDIEDGDLTAYLSWSSSIDGSLGSGGSVSTSALSAGLHTITASVSDSGELPGSAEIQITVNDVGTCPAGSLDLSALTFTDYSNQNSSNDYSIVDGGNTISLSNNTWIRTTNAYDITADTVIEFSFASSSQGEIHAIGFDENDDYGDLQRIFLFWGTQSWSGGIDWTPKYSGNGSYESYSIPVGQYYTGSMYLVFTNDDDDNVGAQGSFRCVRIISETSECDVDEGFESGAGGWTNSESSTCSTGDFVSATPTAVVIPDFAPGGMSTQPGAAHSGSKAWFTATNSSAGVNDVDGGVCITESPVYNVTQDSDISAHYFHVWTQVTTSAAAGDTVQFRMRVSDGPSTGDLVEGGVDTVKICAQGGVPEIY